MHFWLMSMKKKRNYTTFTVTHIHIYTLNLQPRTQQQFSYFFKLCDTILKHIYYSLFDVYILLPYSQSQTFEHTGYLYD